MRDDCCCVPPLTSASDSSFFSIFLKIIGGLLGLRKPFLLLLPPGCFLFFIFLPGSVCASSCLSVVVFFCSWFLCCEVADVSLRPEGGGCACQVAFSRFEAGCKQGGEGSREGTDLWAAESATEWEREWESGRQFSRWASRKGSQGGGHTPSRLQWVLSPIASPMFCTFFSPPFQSVLAAFPGEACILFAWALI